MKVFQIRPTCQQKTNEPATRVGSLRRILSHTSEATKRNVDDPQHEQIIRMTWADRGFDVEPRASPAIRRSASEVVERLTGLLPGHGIQCPCCAHDGSRHVMLSHHYTSLPEHLILPLVPLLCAGRCFSRRRRGPRGIKHSLGDSVNFFIHMLCSPHEKIAGKCD